VALVTVVTMVATAGYSVALCQLITNWNVVQFPLSLLKRWNVVLLEAIRAVMAMVVCTTVAIAGHNLVTMVTEIALLTVVVLRVGVHVDAFNAEPCGGSMSPVILMA